MNISNQDGGLTTYVGDTIKYLCNPDQFDNETKKQFTIIECLPDLTWSRQPPICVGKK